MVVQQKMRTDAQVLVLLLLHPEPMVDGDDGANFIVLRMPKA